MSNVPLQMSERDLCDADDAVQRLANARLTRGYGGYYVALDEDHRDDLCKAWPAVKSAAEASAAKDAEIERLRAEVAVLKAENAHARDCLNSATTLLTGIHSLMYPPEITTADGRVMVFRPKSIDPHEILQGLSDRIRALPDELAALAARKGEA